MQDKDKGKSRKDPLDAFVEKAIDGMDAAQLKALLDKMESTLKQRKVLDEKIAAVEDGKVREALQAMNEMYAVMFDDTARAIAGASEEFDRKIEGITDKLILVLTSVDLVMAVIEQLHGQDAVNEAIRKYTSALRSGPRNLVDPPSTKNDWGKFRKDWLK